MYARRTKVVTEIAVQNGWSPGGACPARVGDVENVKYSLHVYTVKSVDRNGVTSSFYIDSVPDPGFERPSIFLKLDDQRLATMRMAEFYDLVTHEVGHFIGIGDTYCTNPLLSGSGRCRLAPNGLPQPKSMMCSHEASQDDKDAAECLYCLNIPWLVPGHPCNQKIYAPECATFHGAGSIPGDVC